MKQNYFFGISKIIFLFFLALFYSNLTNAQTTIYSEDFTGQNGQGAIGPSTTDTSQVDWTIDISSASLTAATDWFRVTNEKFEARDKYGYQKRLIFLDIALFHSVYLLQNKEQWKEQIYLILNTK